MANTTVYLTHYEMPNYGIIPKLNIHKEPPVEKLGPVPGDCPGTSPQGYSNTHHNEIDKRQGVTLGQSLKHHKYTVLTV